MSCPFAKESRTMNIFRTIAEDVRAAKDRDPASQSAFVIWLTYSGLHARWSHEVEHWLWNHHLKGLARFSQSVTRHLTGTEIHPGAVIGRRFFIDHAMGVVIGETTIIGDDCTLYQGVTLGGTGKETGKRHPTLGNNVMVGVGAAVLGNVTIGDNSKVGGGAVVVQDVPPNCTVVGVPGHIVVQNGVHVAEAAAASEERRESLPDPMADAHMNNLARIELLEERVGALMAELKRLGYTGAEAEAGDGGEEEAAATSSPSAPSPSASSETDLARGEE